MLSQIKNFLTRNSRPASPQTKDASRDPSDSGANAKECPYMREQTMRGQKKGQKCPGDGKTGRGESKESESEEQEQPRGGCPFRGGSDRKKNPNLSLKQEAFDEPFVSKFKYYLCPNKLDFSGLKKGISRRPISRQTFDSHPIYIQHTLFFTAQDYKKVRSLECCSRFLAYEELRERGNKQYNKGKYYQALDYYQRAMSLFRWLQYQQSHSQDESLPSQTSIDEASENKSIDEASENGSKIKIEAESQKRSGIDALEELRSEYKELFVTYHDQNTRLREGEELSDSADIDMRKSLLVQIYLNMAAAYMRAHHFGLAERVCDDGLQLTDRVSQLYFRKAQALALRKDATLQQLALAQQLIATALQMRPNQKIFSSANHHILKMLNLHDSAQAYEQCRQLVDTKTAQLQASERQRYLRLYERARQMQRIEQKIISEGRRPHQNLDEVVLQKTSQMNILGRMRKKYVRVMQFYSQGKNWEQLGLAKKELQQVLRIQHQINCIFALNLQQKQHQLGGIQSEKIQMRIAHIKSSFAETVYNQGRYNFTMLEWVIKETLKEEAEQARAEQQRAEQARAEQARGGGADDAAAAKGHNRLIYLLLLIPLAFILFNFYIV